MSVEFSVCNGCAVATSKGVLRGNYTIGTSVCETEPC